MIAVSPALQRAAPPPLAHAIVLADGVEGLLLARVLAAHVSHVTVVEVPPRAPQALALLAHEQRLLTQLFPSLREELGAAGAVPFNLGLHAAWFLHGRWRPRYRATLDALGCSDDLLLSLVRGHLRDHPRITFLPEEEAARRPADLVVDATLPRPRDSQRVGAGQGAGVVPGRRRVQRLVQRPAAPPLICEALFLQPHAPHQPQGVTLLPVEGGRWQVTLFDTAGKGLPASDAEWTAWIDALPCPTVAALLADATPLSAIELAPDAIPRPHLDRGHVRACGPLLDLGATLSDPYPRPLPTLTRLALACATLDACLQEPWPDGSALIAHVHRLLATELAEHAPVALHEASSWGMGRPKGSDVLPTFDALAHYLDRAERASLSSTLVLDALHRVQQMADVPTLLFRPDIVLQLLGVARPAG